MDDPNINVKIEIKEEMHDVDDEFMCDDDFDEQNLFNNKIDNSELKVEETFIVVEEAADEDENPENPENPDPDPFNSNSNPGINIFQENRNFSGIDSKILKLFRIKKILKTDYCRLSWIYVKKMFYNYAQNI